MLIPQLQVFQACLNAVGQVGTGALSLALHVVDRADNRGPEARQPDVGDVVLGIDEGAGSSLSEHAIARKFDTDIIVLDGRRMVQVRRTKPIEDVGRPEEALPMLACCCIW